MKTIIIQTLNREREWYRQKEKGNLKKHFTTYNHEFSPSKTLYKLPRNFLEFGALQTHRHKDIPGILYVFMES
jgi:hypothetical protein